jgi:HEAT repeat protein
MLEDASPRVRSAATLATCAILHERALESVHPLLEDYAPEVRSAAVAGLIRHGGLDGVLASADTLKRMLSSPSAVERKQAAWVLGTVGVQTFFQPLLPLLDDADEEVRLAAVSAAGSLAAPALIEPLVRQLGNARISSAAAAALAAYGPAAVDTVAAVLADDKRDRVVRASACKVLAKLGDARSVALLHEALANPDVLVRGAAVAALTAVSHRDSSLRVDRAVVAQALRAEAKHAFELIALAEDLALDGDTLLLQDAITHRQQQSLGRIFGLLALRYDAETIDLVSRNLHSSVPATRANAVEVLDNLVAGDEKTFVVALCDDAAPVKKLELVAAFFAVPRTSRRDRLHDLLAGSDEWLQVCAAMAAGAWRVKELEPEVRALLDSPSALCRETAIVALRSLTDLGILRQRLEGLRADPAKSVSRYAEHVLAETA